MLSRDSLQLIYNVFGPESQLQAPLAVIDQVQEIRKWVTAEMAKLPPEKKPAKVKPPPPAVPREAN